MARGKTITPDALKTLGAKRLAEVLAEACESDASLRRKLQILLAAQEGGGKLEQALAKRIATLARSRKFLDWREVPTLAAELAALREGLVAELGSSDPRAAMDQLWRFLEIAQVTVERVDDSNGTIVDVFHEAAADLGALLAKLPKLDRRGFAERLHAALASDDYGVFVRIIETGAPALGEDGRARLRELLKTEIAALPPRRDEESWRETGWPRARLSHHLAALADAEGDVDAYIEAIVLGAREHMDAAGVAERLLAASRPEEALAWVEKDRRGRGPYDLTLASLRIAALDALGRTTEAQALRWQAFEQTLSATHLRDHLKRLPDFDDVEAERRAIAHAMTFPDALTALNFLIAWLAHEAAVALVHTRLGELDGRHYETLGKAAEHLADEWPGAATLLYRAMVLSVLERGFSNGYKYAARDLGNAASVAKRMPAESGIPDHDAFVAGLKAKHGRKYGFWTLATGAERTPG
jgi:hypothetical protein